MKLNKVKINMGYRTAVEICYKGKYYHCLLKDCMFGSRLSPILDYSIDLMLQDFCIYKDYIVNMLNYLNNDMFNCLGKWYNKKYEWGPTDIRINITDKKIIIKKTPEYWSELPHVVIPIIKKVTPEFHNFINRRFLLPQICKKFNIPKDIHNYLLNLFFLFIFFCNLFVEVG
jgi:hypothetical protein